MSKSTFRKVRSLDLRRFELLRPLRPRPARRGRGRGGRGDLECRTTAPGGILNVPQGSGVLDKSWTNDCYIIYIYTPNIYYIYMAYIYIWQCRWKYMILNGMAYGIYHELLLYITYNYMSIYLSDMRLLRI